MLYAIFYWQARDSSEKNGAFKAVWCQLHQVSLRYNKECKKDFLLPPRLRTESKVAFLGNESCPSKLQQDVLKTFESIEESVGLVVVDEEIPCDQTGYSLSIVIRLNNNQGEIAVEIDALQ